MKRLPQLPPRMLSAAGLLFFLLVQCYGVWYMWYEHPGPVGLDDAGRYIALMEYFREFPLITTGGAPLSWPALFSIQNITHSLFCGWFSLLLGVSANTMFHWNFYIGLLLMGLVLFFLFRKIDPSPWFVVPAFILFAFYEGKGSYHGFSWVVPSFYALALFLCGIAVLFYSRRSFMYGLPILLLLLLTHSTGVYLAAVLVGSYILREGFEKRNLRTVMAGFFFASVVLLAILAGEYLNRQQLIPYSLNSSVSIYRKADILAAHGWPARLTLAVSAVRSMIVMYDFAKYFYGINTPLLAYGLFYLVRERNTPLVWLFGSLLTGLIVAAVVTAVPLRFFYALEVVIWIVMAYGISGVLRHCFPGEIGSAMFSPRRSLLTRICGVVMSGLSLLFLYNAVHQKAAHTVYVKYSNVEFFDEKGFQAFVKQHPEKRLMVFIADPQLFLAYEGIWGNSHLKFSTVSSPADVPDSSSGYIIVTEKHRFFDEPKRIGGSSLFVPHGGALWFSAEGLKPGRYRCELIDTGLQEVDGFHILSGFSAFSDWKVGPHPVLFPDETMTPPFLMPWYLRLDKPWPLFRRPIRRDSVVRMSHRFHADFSIQQPVSAVSIVNDGGDRFINGVIRIVGLDDGSVREFDLDWGDERVLGRELGLQYEGKRYPLLWSGAFPGMLLKLEKNFRDVRVFTLYARNWPVR